MRITKEDRAAARADREQAKRKMSAIAVEKMRLSIKANQRRTEQEAEFVESFQKIVALCWREGAPTSPFYPLRKLLERISRPPNESVITPDQIDDYFDRRTLKLQRCLANGWKPSAVHDVLFFAELTVSEMEQSYEQFCSDMTDDWPTKSDVEAVAVQECTCILCGKHFEAKRADARYCSEKCRNKASYRRGRRGNPRNDSPIDTLSKSANSKSFLFSNLQMCLSPRKSTGVF